MFHSRKRALLKGLLSSITLFFVYQKKSYSSATTSYEEVSSSGLGNPKISSLSEKKTYAHQSDFFLKGFFNILELKKIVGTKGDVIFLTTLCEGKNIGGGQLSWKDDTDSDSDDVVFFRVDNTGGWIRDYSNGILATWIGDITDGEDSSVRMNILSTLINKYKSRLILPSGIIRISNTWVLNDADDCVIVGQGLARTFVYGDSSCSGPVIAIRKDGWDINRSYPGPRTRNITLRDFCITGALEGQMGLQSDRDGLFLGGVGFDFEIGYIWFYRLGRRAIVAEDLWDGDIHNCKIHEVGKSKKDLKSNNQAFTFLRKVDSCNAIRITNNHFEHLKAGAIHIQDYCHSFFLSNNKFESVNIDKSFPKAVPIYVGDNHRNFSWFGGFCVLNQQDKSVPYAYIHGDCTRIIGVDFVTPKKDDGASALNLSPGKNGIGAVIQSHFDVRGDLVDSLNVPIYPIVSSGASDFSGSTFKIFNPGGLFKFNSSDNNLNAVSIVGIGSTIQNVSLISQGGYNNKIEGLRYSGIPYSKLSNQEVSLDLNNIAMLYNTADHDIQYGEDVNGAILKPASTKGTFSRYTISGKWRCMGYAPVGTSTIFMRVD